ncbi:MAG: hypothetical protein H7Y88_11150 [Phycisphaerales bacterium]|nr:hypothetical protein [Phycisphaerales bacterium]
MNILCLVLAIAFEIAWAIGLKASAGFSRPLPTVVTCIAYVLSLIFLMLATRKADIGTTYAIWAGAGAAGIAVIGVLWFKEPLTVLKVVSLLLVIAGVVGLNLAERHGPSARHSPGAGKGSIKQPSSPAPAAPAPG